MEKGRKCLLPTNLPLDRMFQQTLCLYSFPKQQILDSSKVKEFADDSFKFDEKGRKFSKRVENTAGKG